MESRKDIFSAQEKVVFALRALYESFGYSRFPMRRFEEYALYAENKSFLKSERVLTFTNAGGKLMALKPDVTLSIVKHTRAGEIEKLYYNESVYRVSQTDHEFSEIQQMGVELLGAVDLYGMCEVLRLAVESLRAVDENYMLEISHMGFAGGLMDEAKVTAAEKEELFSLIRQKNAHELRAALAGMAVSPAQAECIVALTSLAGDFEPTLARAKELAQGAQMNAAALELAEMYKMLASFGLCDCLRLDFSILGDLDYYNGLIFQGYVQGVPRVALSGGRYDPLMRKFGKPGSGIGFALYLDELTRLLVKPAAFDVDILVLYASDEELPQLWKAVDALRAEGFRVQAAPKTVNGLRAQKTLRYVSGGFEEVE